MSMIIFGAIIIIFVGVCIVLFSAFTYMLAEVISASFKPFLVKQCTRFFMLSHRLRSSTSIASLILFGNIIIFSCFLILAYILIVHSTFGVIFLYLIVPLTAIISIIFWQVVIEGYLHEFSQKSLNRRFIAFIGSSMYWGLLLFLFAYYLIQNHWVGSCTNSFPILFAIICTSATVASVYTISYHKR